ncbi:class I glutamine amidotransferase-like protein [Amylocarpus encephaloides]|uniref:Class I glutamine amidotransferase-like protein n=1 Tax=Amylocarpus encephaloides TaxID=45428 RepID=A0A9P7YRE0_9HELO|nr:class I glutamine amidotransferase-like protein [Amylocarpus encephaloides]
MSKPENTVRMLVLETDEPHPDTIDAKGGFGDIFHSLFTEAGNEHNPPLGVETDMRYVVNDPSNSHHGYVPHISEIDKSITAIIITGSMYDAHGDDPWIQELLELLQALWKERPDMKFSGVCFGHQILARALGAKVEQEPGAKWELAHTEMQLTPTGQKLFRTGDRKLSLHQMHQDQVTTVPSSKTTDLLSGRDRVDVWASTEHTAVQGLYIKERLFTSQGHLGFDEKMVQRQIQLRVESGGIKDEEMVEEAKETAHMKHDGLVVAGAILAFFHGDNKDID